MSKVVFKNFYLVNKLATGLVMKAGYITIKVGGFARVMEADLEHHDVVDAINKGWVDVHSEEPDTSDLPKAPVPTIEVDSYRGLTAEELKDSSSDEKTSGATSESIGRTGGVEKTSEATSEKIGQSAEEANGVAKKSRKVATDKVADATE